MNKDSKIYIAGHKGLVGSAILRHLQKQGYTNLIYKTHRELDLTNQQAVADFFKHEQPEYVFLAAAKVGGIKANNLYRADFIYQNLQIQNNVIHHSYLNKVKKLIFLGSNCIYPKIAPQPILEDYLLTGELEYTNEPYAIAKIAGIKMCESYNLQYGTNFIAVMPVNLHGPNDNFNLENSHVLPAMIRKIFLARCLDNEDFALIAEDLNYSDINVSIIEQELAKHGIIRKDGNTILKLWGSGTPRREVMHADDMADACMFVMNEVSFHDLTKGKQEIRNTHLNIGTGKDSTIQELSMIIKQQIGYQGIIKFDDSKPDGTLRKLQDVSKLKELGWEAKIKLEDGIKNTIDWYLNNSQKKIG